MKRQMNIKTIMEDHLVYKVLMKAGIQNDKLSHPIKKKSGVAYDINYAKSKHCHNL